MYINANRVDVMGLEMECAKQGVELQIEDGKVTKIIKGDTNVKEA